MKSIKIKVAATVITGVMLCSLLLFASIKSIDAASEDTVYISLQGTVSLSGDAVTEDIMPGEFKFLITSENEDIYLPSKAMNVEKGGRIALGSFTFSDEGVYTFRITQKNLNEKGYTYDLNPVTAKLTVSRSAGKLSIAAKYYKNGMEMKSISFANQYEAERIVREQQQEQEPEEEKWEDVTVESSDSSEHVIPGSEMSHTITFKNTGNVPLYGIYIREYVPDSALFISCSDDGGYGVVEGREHGTWFVKALQPGESFEFTLNYRVNLCLPDDYKAVLKTLYQITGEESVFINDPEDPKEILEEVEIPLNE